MMNYIDVTVNCLDFKMFMLKINQPLDELYGLTNQSTKKTLKAKNLYNAHLQVLQHPRQSSSSSICILASIGLESVMKNDGK